MLCKGIFICKTILISYFYILFVLWGFKIDYISKERLVFKDGVRGLNLG